MDEKLNDIGYIVPGLGDAGDRQFGTALIHSEIRRVGGSARLSLPRQRKGMANRTTPRCYDVQALAVASQFGITLAVSVVLGFFAGHWLDDRLNTGTTLHPHRRPARTRGQPL